MDPQESAPADSGRARFLALSVSGALLLALGLGFAFPVPRLTLSNTAVVIRYPPMAGLALVAAAAGCLLLALAFRARALRVVLLALAAFVAAVGVDRLLFRLEAGPVSLTQTGALGRTTIPWAQVRRVDPGSSIIVLWGEGDAQIRVSTDSFSPDERATIDRTIARHVREARGMTAGPGVK